MRTICAVIRYFNFKRFSFHRARDRQIAQARGRRTSARQAPHDSRDRDSPLGVSEPPETATFFLLLTPKVVRPAHGVADVVQFDAVILVLCIATPPFLLLTPKVVRLAHGMVVDVQLDT